MFSTVLIPSDLSPTTEGVLECAARLVSLGTRSFVLLHALGLRHLEAMAPGLRTFVEPRLAEEARVLEQAGRPVEVVVAPGVAHEEIRRIVRERRASLVLLGPHGTGVLGELRVGSVTLDTLHRCEVPVLVWRDGPASVLTPTGTRALARRIVYPTDFSDCAERAFSYVRALVKAGLEAVTLLHVQDLARPGGGPASQRVDERDEVDGSRLARLALDLEGSGVSYVHAEVAHGSPAEEILRRVADTPGSLVVMGTHGRGLVTEVLLGSVSHAVARQAPAPVLLVPAHLAPGGPP